jgi:hypothetical protein
VQLLPEHKADIDARNGNGGTSLLPAADYRREAVVLQQLKHITNVDAKDWGPPKSTHNFANNIHTNFARVYTQFYLSIHIPFITTIYP